MGNQIDRNHTGEVSITGDTEMSTEHAQRGVIHCKEKAEGVGFREVNISPLSKDMESILYF